MNFLWNYLFGHCNLMAYLIKGFEEAPKTLIVYYFSDFPDRVRNGHHLGSLHKKCTKPFKNES